MMKYEHIDGSVFTTEAELVAHIRGLGVDLTNALSDEFILDEAYKLGEYEILEQ